MKPLSKDDAIKLGCKKYYTGIPCQNGHDAPRYVNDDCCTECRKAVREKYYRRNTKKVKKDHRRCKTLSPAEYKARKDRARRKAQARKNWATAKAYQLVKSGTNILAEINRLNQIIDDDCQISCDHRDMVTLRDTLINMRAQPSGDLLPRVMVCNHCRKVFDKPGWWLSHKCGHRDKEKLWMIENVPPSMLAARVRLK